MTALRGKDVLFVFVESYGKVALTDPVIAPGVDAVLTSGTKDLADAGFSARSGYLTSSTFGGISWLAHSTLQSGLWIDNQLRYNELVASNRFTLSDAFARAGWRTVGDVPSNYAAWPEGTSFYHYDQIYNAHNVGYVGPQFSYSQMPDQYILSAFQRMELAKPHAPVMAEIDLVSSHTPWAPLPTMVDWGAVGNGSVFDRMPTSGASPTAVWSTDDGIKRAYGQSIQYSMTALSSFVATYPDPNLVMVVLGDHQPASVVSGSNPSHDVPISVIAHDPTVLDRIDGWGWTDGLRPADHAPVWPMDAFRNNFLAAFGADPSGYASTSACGESGASRAIQASRSRPRVTISTGGPSVAAYHSADPGALAGEGPEVPLRMESRPIVVRTVSILPLQIGRWSTILATVRRRRRWRENQRG